MNIQKHYKKPWKFITFAQKKKTFGLFISLQIRRNKTRHSAKC